MATNKIGKRNIGKGDSGAWTMSALLAVEFGSSGQKYGRAEMIEGLRSEGPIRATLAEFKTVALAPDVVLATYVAAKSGPEGSRWVPRTTSMLTGQPDKTRLW